MEFDEGRYTELCLVPGRVCCTSSDQTPKAHRSTSRRQQCKCWDSMHFQTLPVTENCPSHLKPLVDELSGQDYYTSVFVRDFAPSIRTERFHYIRKLEQGLPFRVILYTHSIGGSIGNYHFIWKTPKHANADRSSHTKSEGY